MVAAAPNKGRDSVYTAAIDQGTTGTRFMVFGHDGQVRASAYREHRQIYPQPGWVEHDAQEIWDVTRQVISTALLESGIQPQQLLGIGVTNQRETTVVWDRSTDCPFPKGQIFALLEALRQVAISPPVQAGQVILAGALGTGINVLASRDMPPKG